VKKIKAMGWREYSLVVVAPRIESKDAFGSAFLPVFTLKKQKLNQI
jgi:hypothetical protein